MQATELRNSEITGFFSLPSPSLAEHNPDAYNAAMAEAPQGAGSCAHCGNGIRHHVVVKTPAGRVAFIGTDCAVKIGGTVGECARNRTTTAKASERAAYYAALNAKNAEEERAREAVRNERRERFADAIAALNAQGTEFHRSLAEQLVCGNLSERQTGYAMKAIMGRRNKRNADEWDNLRFAMAGWEEAAV